MHYESDPASYKPPDLTATVTSFEALLSDPQTVAFIAEDADEKAIGDVITFPRTTEGTAVTNPAQFVELNEIAVTARHRGTGVGRALHDRVVEHWTAAGATEIRLTVIAFNIAARRYYDHLGFVETSRRMALRLRQ